MKNKTKKPRRNENAPADEIRDEYPEEENPVPAFLRCPPIFLRVVLRGTAGLVSGAKLELSRYMEQRRPRTERKRKDTRAHAAAGVWCSRGGQGARPPLCWFSTATSGASSLPDLFPIAGETTFTFSSREAHSLASGQGIAEAFEENTPERTRLRTGCYRRRPTHYRSLADVEAWCITPKRRCFLHCFVPLRPGYKLSYP